MTLFMGVDIGSVTSKGVITGNGKIEAYLIIPSGSNYRVAAEKLSEELLEKAGLQSEDIAYITVTGYGTNQIPLGNQRVADIRCCARGINRLFPSVRTVVDAQGQSSQVIRVGENGQVGNFAVSEKCASGSGRFLEIISNVLRVKLEDVGALSLESNNPVVFTTGCAVFGESEAISRVAEGIPKEDILAGVHESLADKIVAFIDRVGLEEQCAISGGGALNIGLVKRIEDKLGIKLLVPDQPQIVNALGAAVMSEEAYKEK
ncbi:acyl-CoA dehydratase activase [Chloroflexota bacterium]